MQRFEPMMLPRSLPILAAFIWTSMVGPSSAAAQITSVTWVKWNPTTSGSSSGMTSFPALSVIQCAVVCSADSQCSHFYFDGGAKTCQLRSYRAGSDGEKDVSNYQRQAARIVPCSPHSDFYKVEGGDACIRVDVSTTKAVEYKTMVDFCSPTKPLIILDQHKIDNITAVLQGLGLYTLDIWLGGRYFHPFSKFSWNLGAEDVDMSLIKEPVPFNLAIEQVCLAFRASRVNKIYYQLCNITLPLACQLPLP